MGAAVVSGKPIGRRFRFGMTFIIIDFIAFVISEGIECRLERSPP